MIGKLIGKLTMGLLVLLANASMIVGLVSTLDACKIIFGQPKVPDELLKMARRNIN